MNKKYDDPPIVVVEWEDCAYANQWLEKNDLLEVSKEITQCRTSGYLIDNNEERLVVVSTLGFRGKTEMLNQASVIPKAQVKTLRVIEP